MKIKSFYIFLIFVLLLAIPGVVYSAGSVGDFDLEDLELLLDYDGDTSLRRTSNEYVAFTVNGNVLNTQITTQTDIIYSKISTVDDTRTNTTTLTAHPELQFTAVANETYYVKWILYWTESGGVSYFAGRIGVPSGTAFGTICAYNTSIRADCVAITQADTGLATNGLSGAIIISSVLRIGGTGGTVSINWAQDTGTVNTDTIEDGSVMEWYQIDG